MFLDEFLDHVFTLLQVLYIGASFGLLEFLFLRKKYPEQAVALARLLGLGGFVFLVVGLYQAFSYTFYVYEEARHIHNIFVKRSVLVSSVWMIFFLTLQIIPFFRRKLKVFLSVSFFALCSLVLFVDAFILYYSGLHITPTAMAHATGAVAIIAKSFFQPVPMAAAIALVVAFWGVYRLLLAISQGNRFLSQLIFLVAALCVLVACVMRYDLYFTLPERLVLRPFVHHSEVNSDYSELPEALQKKLERFGIFYNYQDFYLISRDDMYTDALPKVSRKEFQKQHPNIIILFLESFSSRLTSVYNQEIGNVTPNMKRFSEHPDVTVFHNYYNASTPTATGLLSLLCSHYPTTSHVEIETKGILSGHRLECLPEILKQHGYGYAGYMTSVEKDYGNKNRMFVNMGVDDVLGTQEMSAYIQEDAKSWGYSDHQMFPEIFKFAQQHAHDERPFLMMYSTVDTHPPYAFPKDGHRLDDGSDDVFDTFYSTDEAFGEFWDDFRKSDLAQNSMLVLVADHAAFPSQPVRKAFPEDLDLSYYDQNVFMTYIPSSTLDNEVYTRANGVDFTPTLLHMLGINESHSLEGYSIFEARREYPNLLGMHDLDLYINEDGQESISGVPGLLDCDGFDKNAIEADLPLTLCELHFFYNWKKLQFQKGRFWKHTAYQARGAS
ncbi:sulfatase-like hydrolase/transferase [Candidatus Nomurabacteria bacterium]|nr:sulfatase-like hydrolase/transferase [Candidatus Nomurabacteria bacterium]